ncbi:hypothetical protein [Rhizosaccharibacter radicis]|uniref:Uncharacterized protein n=1 Tax=Rhizosaccharibacter radicis TaxID=2782605 RepID=A0ABT1W2M0_9PROT|nr:hypothetical protein [Acetobacteraceae bacterium KSS12]
MSVSEELFEGDLVMAPLGGKRHRAVVIKIEPTLSLHELKRVQVRFDPPIDAVDGSTEPTHAAHQSLFCRSDRLTKGWSREE